MFEREYRDLAHVPRWGITRNLHAQSVAEHSYYVTLYMSHICHVLNLGNHILIECLRHGLEHDRDEVFTSDIPGPIKRATMDPERLKFYELKEGLKRFIMQKYDTNEVVVAVRKLADLMDEMAYWNEEHMSGNRRARRVIQIIGITLDEAALKVGKMTKNEDFIEPMIMGPFIRGLNKEKVLPKE